MPPVPRLRLPDVAGRRPWAHATREHPRGCSPRGAARGGALAVCVVRAATKRQHLLLAGCAPHRAHQPWQAHYRDSAHPLVAPLAGEPPSLGPGPRGVRPRQHRPVRGCLRSRLAAIARRLPGPSKPLSTALAEITSGGAEKKPGGIQTRPPDCWPAARPIICAKSSGGSADRPTSCAAAWPLICAGYFGRCCASYFGRSCVLLCGRFLFCHHMTNSSVAHATRGLFRVLLGVAILSLRLPGGLSFALLLAFP